jgi:glycine cleavage system H protein
MMSSIPTELRYTETHEWVRTLADGTLEIGITDYAQQQLGELVSVEMPQTGRTLKADETFAVVESVKTASDLLAPVAGEVMAVNSPLATDPEALNADAYGNWLMRIRPAAGALAAAKLLTASEYTKLVDAEGG